MVSWVVSLGAVVFFAGIGVCVGVQFGGGNDKGDVSVLRITCITSGYVKRFFLRASYGADFHVYLPSSPVVVISHATDCGRGGGKLQSNITAYLKHRKLSHQKQFLQYQVEPNHGQLQYSIWNTSTPNYYNV
ncbi:hypothetical protein QQG55_26350 [Brugia pahangi]